MSDQEERRPVLAEVVDLRPEDGGTALPVLLGGGVRRCHRCERTFAPRTYGVVTWVPEVSETAHLHVCRRCAQADPELGSWAEFCDVADSIDALMQCAPDATTRDHLRAILTDVVGHFAVWRDDPMGSDQSEDGGPS